MLMKLIKVSDAVHKQLVQDKKQFSKDIGAPFTFSWTINEYQKILRTFEDKQMIHQIVEDALKCMESYHIPREKDKYEMIYCTGRIEANKGKNEAMTILNSHLDKHYDLINLKPQMSYEDKQMKTERELIEEYLGLKNCYNVGVTYINRLIGKLKQEDGDRERYIRAKSVLQQMEKAIQRKAQELKKIL